MHVDGSNRGIESLNLAAVMGSPDEQSALSAVRSVDLSNNRLAELRDLQALTSLVSLVAAHNSIATTLHLPRTLTKLVLPHNAIASLVQFAGLDNLAELDVAHNRITSLVGVPTTLVALKISHNRLPSLAGVEAAAPLQSLDARSNYVASLEDASAVAECPELNSLWLAGNPIAKSAEYRSAVVRSAPNLIKLDGAPCVREGGPPRTAPRDAPRDVPVAAAGAHPSADPNPRLAELVDVVKKRERELHQTQLLLAAERKENAMLRKDLRRVEDQLGDSKRVVSDELSQLMQLRSANQTLTAQLADQQAKCAKLQRDLKYARTKCAVASQRAVADVEDSRAAQEVVVGRLQDQLEEETARRRASDRRRREVEAELAELREAQCALPAQREVNRSGTSTIELSGMHSDDSCRNTAEEEEGESTRMGLVRSRPRQREPVRSGAQDSATELAQQLKKWLVSQMSDAEPRAETQCLDDVPLATSAVATRLPMVAVEPVHARRAAPPSGGQGDGPVGPARLNELRRASAS